MPKMQAVREAFESMRAEAVKVRRELSAIRQEGERERRGLAEALEAGASSALAAMDRQGGLDRIAQAFEGCAFESSARSVEESERLANELIVRRVEQYPLAERQAGLQSALGQAARAKAALREANKRLKADPAGAIYGTLPSGEKAAGSSAGRRFPALTPDTESFYEIPAGWAQRVFGFFAHRGLKAQWKRARAYQASQSESAWEGIGRYHGLLNERQRAAEELLEALAAREGYQKSVADHETLRGKALDEAGVRALSIKKIARRLIREPGARFAEALGRLPEPAGKMEGWIKRYALAEAVGGLAERALIWEQAAQALQERIEAPMEPWAREERSSPQSRVEIDLDARWNSVGEALTRMKRAAKGLQAALARAQAEAGRPELSALERVALKPPDGLGALGFAKDDRWSLGARAGLLMGLAAAPSRLALEGFGFGEIGGEAAARISGELDRAAKEGEAGRPRAERALALAALEASSPKPGPEAASPELRGAGGSAGVVGRPRSGWAPAPGPGLALFSARARIEAQGERGLGWGAGALARSPAWGSAAMMTRRSE